MLFPKVRFGISSSLSESIFFKGQHRMFNISNRWDSRKRTLLVYRLLAVSVAVACATPCAHAQWTVVNLHPGGVSHSYGLCVANGQQVGESNFYAALWTGSNASVVNLHPPSAGVGTGSTAYAVHDGRQGGYVNIGLVTPTAHASLWSGSAASWVDLHPPGATRSGIFAMHGARQGGFASGPGTSNRDHASLWSGNALSWMDIHPAGARDSLIRAMGPGIQAGDTYFTVSAPNASLWRGTADSWVNLHPAGASRSQATALADGRIYGHATFAGANHAGQWTDSADSWVDFHPAGATASVISGAFTGIQVGSATIGGSEHACVWHNASSSWEDLHVFLPVGTANGSHATSAWRDLRFTYVVGYRFTSPPPRQAVMWTRCNVDLSGNGMADSPDFFAFLTAFFNDDAAADFNYDAVVNSQDFFDFMNAFFAGC